MLTSTLVALLAADEPEVERPMKCPVRHRGCGHVFDLAKVHGLVLKCGNCNGLLQGQIERIK